MENVIIRKAKLEDADKIIDINIDGWNKTYNGLIPKETIDKIQVKNNDRIEKTRKSIKENKNIYLALVDEKIVGFSIFGKARDKNFENSGEIYAEYVLDSYQGLGLGRKMAIYCMKDLLEKGYKTLVTKCLDKNPFNEFHKSLGGILVGQSSFEYLGEYVGQENIYYYNDLKQTLKYNMDRINNKKI